MVRFVAVGDDSGGSNLNLHYSLNGIGWIGVSGIFTTQGNNVGYSLALKRWVATGSGTNTLAWSDDGMNWNGLGTTIFSTEGKGVHYSPEQNLWVATGGATNTLATSPDGINWTGLGNSIFTTRGQDVAFSASLNRWVAVGEGTNTIAVSNDGVFWTGLGLLIFTIPGATKPLGVSYSPATSLGSNGQFQVVGISNVDTQAWSNDGITWTGTGSLFSNTIQDVEYAQGKWVLTGPPNPNPTPFASSITGTSWIIGPNMIGLLNGGRGITYSSDLELWVATGFGSSSLIYSEDAVVWADGGNRFSITGYGIAAGGFKYPPLPLPALVSSLVANNSVVFTGSTAAIDGGLDIIGDLDLNGQLITNPASKVNVTAALISNGTLTFFPGADIQCSQAKILAGSILDIVLDPATPIGTVLNIPIMNYVRRSGSFQIQARSAVFGGDPLCSDLNPTYTSTALSVAVTIKACGADDSAVTGAPNSGETISIPMVVGIVVGVIVVGILVAVLIAYLSKRKNKNLQKLAMADLRQREIDNLQQLSRVSAQSTPDTSVL